MVLSVGSVILVILFDIQGDVLRGGLFSINCGYLDFRLL